MPPATPTPIAANRPLHVRLHQALRTGESALAGLTDAGPLDERDRLLSLAQIHDLHLGPLDQIGSAVARQHHPAVAALKARLEQEVLAGLDGDTGAGAPSDAVGAMRAIARRDLIPPVYEWLAHDAEWEELVAFLALEGGPDSGFDDLVAVCQVGLSGEPKLELARNYWDEMGRGTLAGVHTELHHRLADAIGMPAVPRAAQPTSALLRSTLGGILSTNRALQPEMIGALGLLELQAGPRCRMVLKALKRLGAPDDALAFYVEHAEVDPLHGKGWVDNAVAPLAEDLRWAQGIVRGARWRSRANAAFFADMAQRFVPGTGLAGEPATPVPA